MSVQNGEKSSNCLWACPLYMRCVCQCNAYVVFFLVCLTVFFLFVCFFVLLFELSYALAFFGRSFRF